MLAGLPRPRGQPVELFDIGKPCLRISVVQFGHHEGTVAPLRPAGYRDSLVDVPLGGQARSGSSRQPAGRWRPAQAGVPRKWLVVSTDIANRGFGTPGFDFPTCRKMRNGCRSLVTPPVRRFRLRQRTDEIAGGDVGFSAPRLGAHGFRAGPGCAAGPSAIARRTARR